MATIFFIDSSNYVVFVGIQVVFGGVQIVCSA